MEGDVVAETQNNIIRYSGETYPSKTIIKINSVPISLEGWTIEVRYKVPAGTLLPGGTTSVVTTELIIDGIITSSDNGKVNIYPHARLKSDPVLEPGDYITTELRAKMIADNGGSDAGIPQANQVWDDEEVEAAGGMIEYPFYIVRLKEYSHGTTIGGYVEEQIHNVGLIKIASRWTKDV